jgi:hypothetical protein
MTEHTLGLLVFLAVIAVLAALLYAGHKHICAVTKGVKKRLL